MKRQFTSILLFSALLVGGASTFVSCKDYESDSLYETNGKVTEIAKQVADNATKISDLATDLAKETADRKAEDKVLEDLINSKARELAAKAQEAADAARAAQDKADANEANIGTLTTTVNGLQSQLDALAGLAERLETAENDIARLREQIADIKSCDCDFTALSNKVAILEANQQADEARIAAVESGQNTLSEQIDNINATLLGKVDQTSFDDVKAQVEANRTNVESLTNQLQTIDGKFANYVTTAVYEQKVSDLNTAITNASTNLQNQITQLESKVNEQLNELFNALASQITGIHVGNIYSPVLGYFDIPVANVSSNFLGAYYGKANKEFTIGNETNYVEDLLVDQTTGQNAGTIGVTIDGPENVDFSGLKFMIVDNQGNVTPFVATATKSNIIEKVGYTRAKQVPTNYYELKVNVDPSQVESLKTWTSEDASNLKSAAQNVLSKLKDRKNNLNITDIVNTLYATFNNRLTKYHLYLEYTNTVGEKVANKHVLADNYFVATTIKPLSYEFLKNGISYDIKDIPTLESKGLFIDTSNLKWSNLDHIADINQTINIEVPDASTMTVDGSKVEITAEGAIVWRKDAHGNDIKTNIDDLQGVNVNVNGIEFKAGAIKYQNKTQTVTVTVSMAQFNTMIDQINGQVGNMLGTVEGLADKVNNFVTTIDGSLIDRVNRYIHKCNYWLDNANKFLQPAMFATDGTNWVKLPTIANGATYVKMSNGQANVLLLPTSYTLEYIAPAYKKYITVTDPTGAKVTGNNVGTVVSGNVRKAGFTATKEGVYTITYDAVDYAGVKVSKNFYIKVVK